MWLVDWLTDWLTDWPIDCWLWLNLQYEDYKTAYEACHQLMQLNYSAAWVECKALAEAVDFSDVAAKQVLCCDSFKRNTVAQMCHLFTDHTAYPHFNHSKYMPIQCGSKNVTFLLLHYFCLMSSKFHNFWQTYTIGNFQQEVVYLACHNTVCVAMCGIKVTIMRLVRSLEFV